MGTSRPATIIAGVGNLKGSGADAWREKLYLEDEDGERLIALIGYSPAELAAREDELEVWYD